MFCASGLLFSCKKEKIQERENEKMTAMSSIYQSELKTENGYLVFDSKEKFDEYISFLDEAITTSKDVDSTLDAIEQNYLGFTSFRKNEININKGPEGDINYDKITQTTFSHILQLKSVLNKNKEVKIGDSVYYVHDNNFTLKFPSSLLDNVRNAASIGVLENIEDLVVEYPEEMELMSSTILPHVPDNPFSDNPRLYSTLTADNCSGAVTLKNIYIKYTGGLYVKFPRIEINWGDGSQIQVFSSSTPNFYANVWFGGGSILQEKCKFKSVSHTFSTNGPKTIKIKVYPNVLFGQPTSNYAERIYNYNLENACTDRSKASYGWAYGNNGNDKLETKLEVYNSWLMNRVIAESVAFKKKNNGGWEKRKTEINVNANGIIKNQYCNQTSIANISESWASKKQASCYKGNGVNNSIYYSEFNSYHSMKAQNNTIISQTLKLNACN